MSIQDDEMRRNGGVMDVGNAIIMTRDAYAASIGYSPEGKPMSVTARFGQGDWWRRLSGEWVRIGDMTPQHRYNTAAILMRGARIHAFRFAWEFAGEVGRHNGGEMAHDSLERELDHLNEQAFKDPQGWLRETTLYKALTAGLTVTGDGTEPWQKTGRDPVTGEPTEVPLRMTRVCEIPDCGCSGEAHA